MERALRERCGCRPDHPFFAKGRQCQNSYRVLRGVASSFSTPNPFDEDLCYHYNYNKYDRAGELECRAKPKTGTLAEIFRTVFEAMSAYTEILTTRLILYLSRLEFERLRDFAGLHPNNAAWRSNDSCR
ncbi:hypothetical protein PM082_013539 [Marasmius tenuissimus]|nr:hypothetical protein PM082_013539 [Marasmius tenuissimus]